MASAKYIGYPRYIGYLSGVAVAAGVGAAIAVSGQGTAHADTPGESSSSPSEKPASDDKGANDNDAGAEAGPKAGAKFDPAEAVRKLTSQFAAANSAEPETDSDDEDADVLDDEVAEDSDELDDAVSEDIDEPDATDELGDNVAEDVAEPEGAEGNSTVFAALTVPSTDDLTLDDTEPNLDGAAPTAATAGPVPWSPNPFRPMPPEPAPNDMPGVLWDVEQNILNAFEPVPLLQPFVREGYEAGYRFSQMIPWVNVVVPLANIAGQVPNLLSGDPVLFRDASQSMINNLLVTIHPVSVLYYVYDEIADLINLEYEAQQLKEAFYATTWNILDPFALLHNRGQSGLPLSPSSPSSTVVEAPVEADPIGTLQLLAAVDTETTDDPGSDPFRAVDPDPIGMPQALIDARNLASMFLPSQLRPLFREAFELTYRASQVVPFVNAVLPAAAFLPALIQAIGGDKAGAQIAINQLLLTTAQVSFVYYVYDQIADLLNVEQAAFAAKEQLYIQLWDTLDPAFILHNMGESGL
ncbi:hypothetical protein JDV09_20470 [Mycobacterium sp. Y57]|uniref:hypothetical protein n=1 Tax=Mycolicibacterium xanthum TaxID=2796469 RepID=UPI001C84DCCB|nr:hypothetical protein [Mycolicibacterium xanthum]MBX7434455.1 hypothetical protein [Mycolicibacterium xanthum]